MKLIVLAAAIGYVYGAILDADCGAGLETAATCDAGLYCDLNGTPAGTVTDAATSGTCAARVAAGLACTATGAECIENNSCVDDLCKGDDGQACADAVEETTSVTTPYTGLCDADDEAAIAAETTPGTATTCQAATNADNSDVGCGLADTVVADTALEDGKAGGPCREASEVVESVSTGNDDAVPAYLCGGSNTNGVSTCVSAVCTAATPGVGATGGACREASAAVSADDAVTACDASLATTNCPDDGAASTDTTTFCGAESIANAADGADGGNCRLVVAEADEVLACDKAAVAADTAANPPVEASPADVCNGADAAATPPVVGTCGPPVAATDDAPAAIFYGMSMVTAAIAYLL